MRDLPNGPALLALARDVLLSELLPLLPEDRRLDARLVANAMAVAEREGIAGEGPADAVARELVLLYCDSPRDAIALRALQGAGNRSAIPHLTPPSPPPGAERVTALRRFAQDLRRGAFEGSPPRERAAQALLWHLTFARLREGNPRFLAANGFGRSR